MGFQSRRQFIRLAAGAAALPAVATIAKAQAYPVRPVKIVIGVAAGSPQDVISRLVGEWLTERMGQSFVIDNRPGAGTNIATEAVVRAPADGYMLLSVAPSSAINATLYENLNFNFIRDFAPIGTIVHQASIMVVNPSVPAKSVPEFIAYAKANPSKLNMASSGVGTGPHLAGELFKMLAAVDFAHVPYRGAGPATIDLVSGQVQVMFLAPVLATEYIRSGKLRALAVTTASRSDTLPDVPSIAEFLPGYEYAFWCGIAAPKGTPSDIVDKLNKEINAGLANPRMQERIKELGGGIAKGSPADFGKLIASETEKWGKVVRAARLKTQ